MSNILVETEDVVCVECEWLAVFQCAPCGELGLVCGRHRFPHYAHNLTAPEEVGKVTKGGKKK